MFRKLKALSRMQLGAMTLLAVTGLGISSYLAYHSLGLSAIAGCNGSSVFDCDHVLNSHWSKVLGVPVSFFAVVNYVFLLGAMVVVTNAKRDSTQLQAASLVALLSLTAGLAAIWFIGLQALVLQHFCLYCLVAHLCGIFLATISLVGVAPSISLSRLRLGMVGFCLVTVVAAVQVATPEAPPFVLEEFPQVSSDSLTDEFDVEFISPLQEVEAEITNELMTEDESKAPVSERNAEVINAVSTYWKHSARGLAQLLLTGGAPSLTTGLLTTTIREDNEHTKNKTKDIEMVASPPAGRNITILSGSLKLDTSEWPMIGDPNAKHVAVELFDYTCLHCRESFATLNQTKKNRGKSFALMALPVPMHNGCNNTVTVNHPKHAEACELAKIAIAVWLTSPASFEQFHNWMMQGANAPTAKDAKAKAVQLVNEKTFSAHLKSNLPANYVASTVKIYKRANSGAIPKLIFPNTALVGKVTSVQLLDQMISQNLGK